MYQIKKMRSHHVIDFAAEELKKYLRMMMPEAGDVEILYEPNAKDGFRLGFAEDFGLTFEEVEDPVLDDVVHIETDKQGGILTGSNPRSVLFAVYRFLKENGCRWLFPGIDGEYIPVKDIEPISYHHLASFRFRGHCNEGAESQQAMLETIDFYAKLEINLYMLEFDNPYVYYERYYNHTQNHANRKPEPVSFEQVKQWKRQCEVEIAKRGLQFHDMGHGWTAEPFGLSSVRGWKKLTEPIPEERFAKIRPHLAMVDGNRDLIKNVPLNTNLCMSNPETRKIFVKGVADYAEKHKNVTYLNVNLADGIKHHCECEECRKLTPSDYYVMILNELDEELTKRNLDTRIVFSAYVDTAFPPMQEKIKNTKRFLLMYAPFFRPYTSSVCREKIGEAPSFVLNAWEPIDTVEKNAALLLEWQKNWKGCCFGYEYHFWMHMYRDPGLMSISKRIYEDIQTMEQISLDGYLEDGTQRGCFPNGFAYYVYAEALLNKDKPYEEIKEDYFRHAYGEYGKEAAEILDSISELFDYAYMQGEKSVDYSKSKYHNPAQAEKFKKIKELTERERAFAEEHADMPMRSQTVAMRLLTRHAEYCEGIAGILAEKAVGNQQEAKELLTQFKVNFGRYEIELDRYYDQFMMYKTISNYMDEVVVLN